MHVPTIKSVFFYDALIVLLMCTITLSSNYAKIYETVSDVTDCVRV